MTLDVGYITKYMIEYDSGVPVSVIIGISFFVCASIVVLYRYSFDSLKFLRNASWCILVGYLFFIFCTTVLFRDVVIETRYRLLPLWSYGVLYNKLLAENILNVLMFIPIGFFSSVGLRKRRLLKITGIGCGISLTIEVLQLVYRRGVFNIDDIIHNTLGCAIGYGIFRLCNTILTACTK